MHKTAEWKNRTKNIAQVIEELKSFEDRELVVVVTDDEGQSFKTVKLLSKGFDGDTVYCVLHV